jgi:hypothetical protein
MLTVYFKKNRIDETAQGILYRDFPKFYTWQAQGKVWQNRVCRDTLRQIGRIVSANLAEGECYYLRVLLNHVAGATSFERLRTMDGKIIPTFREAAERWGLIEQDNTLNESLAEATDWMLPYVLRRLFTTILKFCEPSDVFGLWEKYKEAMSEDYKRNNQSTFMVEQMVLINI